MIPSSRPPRISSRQFSSLHHSVNMYAVAASAAGVGLLALAQPSEAKVVYTKTHQVIGANGIYPLDLNHDGIIDFLIQEQGYSGGSGSNRLEVNEAFGNAVEGSNYLAAAVKKGEEIGPRQQFITDSNSSGEAMVWYGCGDSGCSGGGNWVNVNNRYLGLRFRIGKAIHYGWARLSVQASGFKITATLTGYAYETVAKKAIRAGQINGSDITTSPPSDSTASDSTLPPMRLVRRKVRSTSLGQLALGSLAIAQGRQP